jgi:hypothetical protein
MGPGLTAGRRDALLKLWRGCLKGPARRGFVRAGLSLFNTIQEKPLLDAAVQKFGLNTSAL